MERTVTVEVNGRRHERSVEPRLLLVHFLRDVLGLTGTHWGCDTSNCGTCVVLLDGEPVQSCTVLAAMAGGHEGRTVEGSPSHVICNGRVVIEGSQFVGKAGAGRFLSRGPSQAPAGL